MKGEVTDLTSAVLTVSISPNWRPSLARPYQISANLTLGTTQRNRLMIVQ